jgi:hypothetical protein
VYRYECCYIRDLLKMDFALLKARGRLQNLAAPERRRHNGSADGEPV